MMGGLMIWGLNPGPALFVEQKDFVWGLIASMYVSNIVAVVLVLTTVPIFAALMRVPKLFSLFTVRRARRAAGEIRGRLDPLIKARMNAVDVGEPTAGEDILATLLAVEDPETGTRFSYEELCEEVATLMLAGHETSSSTLAWALYLLAKAPDIQERALAEFCKHGHAMTPENVSRSRNKPNARTCKTCNRLKTAAYRAREKGLAR